MKIAMTAKYGRLVANLQWDDVLYRQANKISMSLIYERLMQN